MPFNLKANTEIFTNEVKNTWDLLQNNSGGV